MKKRFFNIVFVFVMLINSLVFTSCNGEKAIEDLPITYAHGTYLFDVDDPQAVVGFVDSVFIGYVEEQFDMRYNGGLPYQYFNVKVLENIKGNLAFNSSVKVEKFGGLAQDKKSIILIEDDILPEKDKIYIFLVMIGDGDIVGANGPNTVIPLESGINAASMKNASFAAALSNSDILQKYIDAYENEIPFERERTEYIQQD